MTCNRLVNNCNFEGKHIYLIHPFYIYLSSSICVTFEILPNLPISDFEKVVTVVPNS